LKYIATEAVCRTADRCEGKLALINMLVDELKRDKTPKIQELIEDIDKAIENKNSSV